MIENIEIAEVQNIVQSFPELNSEPLPKVNIESQKPKQTSEVKSVKSANEQMQLIQKFINDGIIPPSLKTVNQVMAVASYGASLNFNFWESILHIYLLNNKPSIMASGLRKLIFEKGHYYRVLRDYSYVYETDNPDNLYLTGKKILDDKGEPIRRFIDPAITQNKQVPNRVTTLECYSKRATIAHKQFGIPLVPEIINFTLSEAYTAGLVSEKGVWSKYTGAMLFARCLAKANTMVFDAASGFYTYEELASLSDKVSPEMEEMLMADAKQLAGN